MGTVHTHITDYLVTQSWQIAALVLVAAAVTLALKNRSAHARYLLWLIVLAKCLVPPAHTIRLAVLPERKQPEVAATIPVEMPPLAVTVRAVPAEPVISPPAPIVHQPASKSNIMKSLARLSLHQWLALSWSVGVIGFILAAVTKALRVNAWLRRERRALPRKLQMAVEKVFNGLGVKTGPKVWLVEGIGQPFVWGLLRGDIYLPGNFAKLDSDENRRNVLGHELSHVLRFDAAVNVLQIIAQAIFWFHPFVWWANKKIRAEREKCCDEMAIARLGAKAKDYGSAIVNTLIAEHKAVMPIPSLAVAGPVRNIEDRIKTIMNPRRKFYRRPSFITIAAVLLLAAVAVPTTLALTRRSANESNVADDVEETWGQVVNGLRCRWLAVPNEIQAGVSTMVGMEVENVSGEEIFWQCREGTWLIRHPQASPGTPVGTSPKFEVSFGEGVREATTEEAQRRHEGSGRGIGYYVLGPGARISITAPYPYPLAESGPVEVEGFLYRENPGGGGAYFRGQVLRNVMTCPPLVLEVVGGIDKAVIEGLSISVACAEERVKTADELELVVTVENKSGAEVELHHGALEDDFPIVVLDMASQESGPHVLCTKEGGLYGTGLVPKSLKNNEERTKTIPLSDCWRWYGGRPILSPGRYQVRAKVTSLTATGQLVESESQPIRVTVLEWPWGEPVQGVQVRLRPDKVLFAVGERPVLKADIYNGGESGVSGQQTQYGISRLQFDNHWYEWGGGPYLGPPIKPDDRVEGIAVPLDSIWMGEEEINLSPGKHIIRVAFVGSPRRDSSSGAIMAFSNPIETTIIADERIGEGAVPCPEGFPYPVPWWQAGGAGEPNSAVQIEARFLLVPADAKGMGEFLLQMKDSEIAALWAEPNVQHYLLEGEESGRLLEKLTEGEPNCGMILTVAPRVTVLSGESAALSIQTDTVIAAPPPVISKILPKLGAKCRTFEPAIPTGTTLNVTPTLAPDKENILLHLNIEMTNFLGMKTCTFEVPTPDGGVAEYEQELPQIETTSVQTRVSIPDGGTLLLAGQKIEMTRVQTRVSAPDGGTLLLGGQKVKKQDEQDGQTVEKDLLILIKAEVVEVDPNSASGLGFRQYGGYGATYGPGPYGGYGPYGGRYGGGYGGYGGGQGGYGGAYVPGLYGGVYPYGPYGRYGDGGHGGYGLGYGGGYGGYGAYGKPYSGWYGTYGGHRFEVPYGGIDPCRPYGGAYGRPWFSLPEASRGPNSVDSNCPPMGRFRYKR